MNSQKEKLTRLFKLLKAGFGQYRWQIASMAILSFLSGILEGVGINAIIPLFSFVNGDNLSSPDFITKFIQRFFLYFNLSYSLKYLLIFIAILFLAKAIFLFIGNYIMALMRRDYEKKTRGELFKLFLKSDWPYLSQQKVGHLDHVLITDTHMSAAILSNISAFILTLVNLIIYILLVVNISFWVAALSMVFGVSAYFIFTPWFRKTRILSGESARVEKEVAHYVNENIIGMKTVKAISVEEEVFKRGSGYFDYLRNILVKVDALQITANTFLQLIGVLFILSIFSFFYKTAGFSIASFTVIVYAVNRVFSGIQGVQSGVYALNSYVPHLASVLKYLDETKRQKEDDLGEKEFDFNERLEFKNVSFSYDKERAVLFNASFFIKRGEIAGLIGPSGAGKTTIVDLLLRLLNPQAGKILLDGKDILDINLKEWRTSVGYVSQDIFLMNDTILNNIRFYNNSLSYDEAVEAAKMANIYDFIESQPEKFETAVGERGIRLSGGQRQRIVLARVLARKPKILILDEATSALDNESEIAVQKAIDSLRGKITVFTIAHRLSTVVNSDRLIVLEDGKIVEAGSPRELLKDKESYFSKVYNLRK